MPKTRKWEINQLRKNKSVAYAAKIILRERLANLFNTIEKYFNEMNADNLHDIRISLRRVRYNMELFILFFNKKQFMNIYRTIESLQDLSGVVRDLDVFKDNINLLIKERNVKVNKAVLNEASIRRSELEDKLKLALMRFIHNKSVKNFFKILH